MNIFQTIFSQIDSFFIYFYRIPEIPILGYLLGTSVLALFCVLFGQMTLYTALTFNKKRVDQDNQEMVRMHNLSVYALLAKDKKAYKACNKEANEAFGKYFFSQIAMSISSLWPVPFALGWMQTRFLEVDFALPFHIPLVGDSVGYPASFIPLYILVYICWGKLKHHLPFFKAMEKTLYASDEAREEMVSLGDFYSNPKAMQKSEG